MNTTKTILACAATAMIAAGAAETNATAAAGGVELVRRCVARSGFRLCNVEPDPDRPKRKTLADFVDVLNENTWAEYDMLTMDMEPLRVIEEIHLPGVEDPMIFAYTAGDGPIFGTTIHILRQNPETGMWHDLHGPLEEGEMTDLTVFPVDIDRRTMFLNVDVDFGSMLQDGFDVLDYDPDRDEWITLASAQIRHSFRLSDEDRVWVSNDCIDGIVRHDLTRDLYCQEFSKDGELRVPSGTKTIRAIGFTATGKSPNGFFVSVWDGDARVWPMPDDGWPGTFVRGFLAIERTGRHFLVLVGYDNNQPAGFGLLISVLDTGTLETVHRHFALDDVSLVPLEANQPVRRIGVPKRASAKPEKERPAEPPAADTKEYVVKEGDDIYSIAMKHDVTPLVLRRLNPGKDLAELSPGDRIRVPDDAAAEAE